MGKIVKLKNKKTGVRVYPVTATSAVVDANSGERLNDTLLNKVEEAPMDDSQYARINGAWAKVEGGGDETALITLLPNSSDLYGATVKVTTEGGETLLDTTWQGAALSVVIPAKTVYTVTVGEKDGFIAPSAVTHTAVGGGVRSIAMTYTASTLTVNILSNQGTSDADISSVKATVAYGSTSVQVSNGKTISLPLNTAVTITFPAVANYKAPDSISFTHTGGNVEKSGTYQTEVVNVSLSAEYGASVEGQKVTINENVHTWDGTVISQKVAFGTNYSVEVDVKEGYTSPASKNFTANQVERTLALEYKVKEYSVFIQDTEGNLYKDYEWSSKYTPNGIAVITSECEFVVSLKNNISNVPWGEEVAAIEGLAAKDNLSEAILDVNGFNNTLLMNDSDVANCAYYCTGETFPNGNTGYIGAAGEWKALLDNYDDFVSACNACGAQELTGAYWTSTLKSEDWFVWYVSVSSKTISDNGRSAEYNLRSFTTLD